MSDSSRPHGLQPTRLLRPWDFPGKSTGVGCHCLRRFKALLLLLLSRFSRVRLCATPDGDNGLSSTGIQGQLEMGSCGQSIQSRLWFPSGHVWMWESDYKESWVPKNWCFWTMVLDKTLESPLDSEEIQPVYPKGDQSWVFIWRTDFDHNREAWRAAIHGVSESRTRLSDWIELNRTDS